MTLLQSFPYVFEGAKHYPPLYEWAETLTPPTPVTLSGKGGSVQMTPLTVRHGAINNLALRIGDHFAYVNDVHAISEDVLDQLRDVTHLVVDCLRDDPHPSHAHLRLALEWADSIRPQRVWLTNLHIDLDYDALARRVPVHVQPCFDGQVISFPV